MENGVYFKQSRKMFLILMKDGMAFRDEWFCPKESRSRLFFVLFLAHEQAITRTKQFILECYFVLHIYRPQMIFLWNWSKIYFFPFPSPGWCSRHWVTPCLCLPFTTPTDLLIHLSRGPPPAPFILIKNSPSPQMRSQCLSPKPVANHRSGDYGNFTVCCLFFLDKLPFFIG